MNPGAAGEREPRDEALMPAALGVAFLLIPLFPAFITLTGQRARDFARARFADACARGGATLIAFYGAARLVSTPGEPIPTRWLRALPAAAIVAAVLGFDPRAARSSSRSRFSGWCACDDRAVLSRADVEATIYAAFRVGAIAALAAILMVVRESTGRSLHRRARPRDRTSSCRASWRISHHVRAVAYAIARVTERRDLRLVAYAARSSARSRSC